MQPGSGPTTILFTDIEGSTRLWETQPDLMSKALRKHDALARDAVERHGGIVVKSTGDGMYAAFADPVDGIRAIVGLQQALADPGATAGVPLRIRCGLHVGEVEHRDNDFFGPPVNRSARIMGAAHGGQILVSQAVADGVHGRLPGDIVLRDLGGVRLKDLASPERVYQIVHPQLRQDFPALRSLESTPNNLPQQLTTFVGRERELHELAALLGGSRLLTLCGMGGLGKTRLSLQIAADALDEFPDGVWFVDLAPIQDASLVPSVLAQVLGVQEEPGRALTDALCAHLKSRTLLVILDNCEHLVAACAKLANSILRAACDVRIIATSREALRIPGEQTYSILPLPVPDKSATVDMLRQSDAVLLFVDRARTHKPAFELGEREAPAVAEIVARLEGIPLALELAAARLRVLSLADINTRLRDRFKLLTGGGRVVLERQQTLRALVTWSYDLLQPHEQVLFDRLCVFAGGFDLESAEKVCSAEPLAPEEILDLVSSLVDKSLVNLEELEEGSRYRSLETIRDFAREKLVARGEAETLVSRHCEYFLVMAKAANKGSVGDQRASWFRRLELELDNMRAAITSALDGMVDPIIAVKYQVALMTFWILRGYVSEGRKSVDRALASPVVRAAPIVHAHGLYVGAALATMQGDHACAADMLQECLDLRRSIGNPLDVAATLSTLALVRLHIGDPTKAQAGEQEAIAIFRQLDNRVGEIIGLLHLGQIAMYTSRDTEARAYLTECVRIANSTKYREIECEARCMLGEIALDAAELAAARAEFIGALDVSQAEGDKRNAAGALWGLGRVDLAADNLDDARGRLNAALEAYASCDLREEVVLCLEDHARLAHAMGSHEDAARLYGAVSGLRAVLALARWPRTRERWEGDVTAARKSAGETEFARSFAQGEQLPLDAAIRYALTERAVSVAARAPSP